ncbi:MAG: hypothetical protein RQ751_02755 [Longimicrobiales bacterium]|nr:hypothetical protein [Longimicrobiales bacterium]
MVATFVRVIRGMPAVVWAAGLLLLVEVAAYLVLPALVPESRYLDRYVPASGHLSVEAFLAGEHLLTPDTATGWRSTPDQVRGNWVTDSLGARATHRHQWWDPSLVRILALGSSMMNGGGGVTNDGTITAHLESAEVTTLNFGTMLYGADQALMLYRSRLRALRPHVVVLGLDGDPLGALVNLYVPLRNRDETNMPFVKPRYVLRRGSLEKIPVDPPFLLGTSGGDSLLAVVREYDEYYPRLVRFARLEQTPMLGTASWLIPRIAQRLPSALPDHRAGLLDAVLKEVGRVVRADGAELLILAMPPGVGGLPGLGDTYATRLDRWRGLGFRVVDGRDVLERSGEPEAILYSEDGVHLTSLGNAVLAGAVRWELEAILDRPLS